MNRSLWAVLFGTFTLRFSTGLTGATLTFYLAHLHDHEGILDQVLGLGGRSAARFEAATLTGILSGFAVAGVLWDPKGPFHLGPATFLVNAVIYLISFLIYRYGVDPGVEGAGRAAAAGAAAVDAAPAVPRFDFARYRKILTGTHVWLLAPTWIAINAVLGL